MMKYLSMGWEKCKSMSKEITKEMLCEFEDLNELKKDVEKRLDALKKTFHLYFDENVGVNEKGELTIDGYKLQRAIRKVEKFDIDKTVDRLESLNMVDLIQVIKKPDEEKVKAALNLGFLKNEDLEGCIAVHSSGAIYVKPQ
jgi:alanyl-tRNA synthetase